MKSVLAVGYPSKGSVDVVLFHGGLVYMCPGKVKDESYADGVGRRGWYRIDLSPKDVGIQFKFSEGACSSIPEGLSLGAWLGHKTLFWFVPPELIDDSRSASYILYSKDPHYHLVEGPSGARRWMLTTKSGLLVPTGIPAPISALFTSRSEGDILDRITSWREKKSVGHSTLFIVTDENGAEYTLKWHDGPVGDPLQLDGYGVSDWSKLLPEYEELYRMVGAPYMPQWISGDLEEFKEEYPDMYRIIAENAGADPLGYTFMEDEVGPVSTNLISSVYVAHPYIDWRYIGETPQEASRNLAFLQAKEDAMRELIGPPDRENSGNYLMYALADESGEPFLRSQVNGPTNLRVDIDFDWGPDYYNGNGMYSGLALEGAEVHPDTPAYSKAVPVAYDAMEDAASRCLLCINDEDEMVEVKERLQNEGKAERPEHEALLDVMSHVRDFRTVSKGYLPGMVGDALEEVYLENGPLVEAVETWEEVKKDRLGEDS